jgi:hypothetical protein
MDVAALDKEIERLQHKRDRCTQRQCILGACVLVEPDVLAVLSLSHAFEGIAPVTAPRLVRVI